VVRRAAFDIGSATTKLKVAEVDICRQRIIKVLLRGERPVFYRDDVGGSDGRPPVFSEARMARGIAVIDELKLQASSLGSSAFAAVATSAFRRAANGVELVARIKDQTDIDVSIISQQQEAVLGFRGAVLALGVSQQDALVWDVGGRSMQFCNRCQPADSFSVYQGKLASGQMRDHIIRVIQSKPEGHPTPNPITPAEAAAAINWVEQQVARDALKPVRDKLADPKTIVLGIGALKYYAGKGDPNGYSRSDLERQLSELIGATDAQIGGDYAATAVSDRLLIVAFMRALGIERVQLADVDLANGLLIAPQHWQSP